MSRARKGLKKPVKKTRQKKTAPRRQMQTGRQMNGNGGDIFCPVTSDEAEALSSALGSIFGPIEGRIVGYGMSGNLKL